MKVNDYEAHAIMGMADAAASEGMLDEDGWEIVQRLIKMYPHLKEEYSWMFTRPPIPKKTDI